MSTPTEHYQHLQGTLKPSSPAPQHRRLFGPPDVPVTSSKSINNLLNKYCGQAQENPVRAVISYFICYMFQMIQLLYSQLNRGAVSSQPLWIASCSVVSLLLLLLFYILYHLVVLALCTVHYVTYYCVIVLALVGVGLAISAAVIYGKDTAARSPSQASTPGEGDYDSKPTSPEAKTKYY